MLRRSVLCFGLVWIAAVWHDRPVHAADPTKFFDEHIAPLLARRCLECHNATDRRGGLDLSRSTSARRGGESGPAFLPGAPEESLLWRRVRQDEMPPEKQLQPGERVLLRKWIATGARWGQGPIDQLRYTTDSRAGFDWWSLQPISEDLDERLARLRATDGAAIDARNPIDVFVSARLRGQGLTNSEPADRPSLIRRLSFDLLGLPPDLESVEQFASDPAPDAYARLVDRFLGSFHYGERWARHWLDVVRFGESHGFERDNMRSNSWRFRDWVVAAFNADMRYDRFVRLQLAGDVLKPEDPSALIATGFLVAGPYDEVGNNQQSDAMKAVVRQDELEDIAAAVGQTFLGLTVNCARCHDHKFDPVRQSEYYQLTAALSGVRHGQREVSFPSEVGHWRQGTARIDARIRIAKRQLDAIQGPAVRQLLRGRTDEPAEAAVDTPRPVTLEQALGRFLSAEDRDRYEHLLFELDQLESQRTRITETSVYAVTPRTPAVTHVLLRGNTTQPGAVVAAGGVAAVSGVDADFGLRPDASDSLRRMRLSHWITDRHNPLFARVIVNRLWHYHFGVGLVDTPNDFGFNGGRPTHPLLLDWLARELIRSDWSLKTIQRLIVSSSVYRQSSRLHQDALRVDAQNRMLWRKAPLRLEAEAIRDTILLVAGELNSSVYGPGFYDFRTYISNSHFYEMRDPRGPTFHRRSLYRTWVRSGRNHLLDVFDCPDPSAKAPQRTVTTTPLQALSLQNNSFVLRMSDRFAARVRADVGPCPTQQVARAYQLALARSPDPEESKLSVSLVQRHGLAALCRVLFNSNEFLYID